MKHISANISLLSSVIIVDNSVLINVVILVCSIINGCLGDLLRNAWCVDNIYNFHIQIGYLVGYIISQIMKITEEFLY
jgi:hypothetical protein